MCGLFAWIYESNPSREVFEKSLNLMYRRGPDDCGIWEGSGVLLGHRRLSVIDLNHRSSQPMHSVCKRYSLIFNGEIYNFKELRAGLIKNGFSFTTSSDSEVLLKLFIDQGEKMLGKLHGMFAFLIWDSKEKKAFVARDPYGIKPLYIAKSDNGFIISSQIKPIISTGAVSSKKNILGESGYFMLGSVPEPYTLYEDISSLKSGCYQYISIKGDSGSVCWNDISKSWLAEEKNLVNLQKYEIQNIVSSALRESVNRHLVSDVPIGVFLSGGIDSGALVGLISENNSSKVQSITITYSEFKETINDESRDAALIAKHYGVSNYNRVVSKEEFFSDLPNIFSAMDQPSIDGVNTWYACKAANELGLKVVISGVGGDELFFGYNHFKTLPTIVYIMEKISRVPGIKFLIKFLFKLLELFTKNNRWEFAYLWLKSIEGAWWLKRSSLSPRETSKLLKNNFDFSRFSPVKKINSMVGPLSNDKVLALAQIESSTYLRNQLLRDSDWASMYHSIELRTPLVDARLIDSLKHLLPLFKQYKGKEFLANSPNRPLPDEIINRPKTGFSIPVKSWMKEKYGNNLSWQEKVYENWML